MTEREQFRLQLQELGIKPGDTVLVHSSMKAIQTRRTPDEVIEDLNFNESKKFWNIRISEKENWERRMRI